MEGNSDDEGAADGASSGSGSAAMAEIERAGSSVPAPAPAPAPGSQLGGGMSASGPVTLPEPSLESMGRHAAEAQGQGTLAPLVQAGEQGQGQGQGQG